MTVKELQKAIHDQSPIEVYNKDSGEWTEFKKVIGILYSEAFGQPIISAIVIDVCGHSQTVAKANHIRIKEDENGRNKNS